MSIRNRLNRFIKQRRKAARKKFADRQGILSEFQHNRERQGKTRGLDGTMFGPFRSRGT